MNYLKQYFKLIKKAKARNSLPDYVYFELHHIIPRSLGGSDNANNLVALTFREHFIAHKLLFKIFKNRQNIKGLKKSNKEKLRKMAFAYVFMCNRANTEKHNGFQNKNSHQYAKSKQKAISDIKKYEIDLLKEMFNHYISKKCFEKPEEYEIFQQKFNFPYSRKYLSELFRRNGFIINESKKIPQNILKLMYQDLNQNKKRYEKENFQLFQNKWNYHKSRKHLTDYFRVNNINAQTAFC